MIQYDSLWFSHDPMFVWSPKWQLSFIRLSPAYGRPGTASKKQRRLKMGWCLWITLWQQISYTAYNKYNTEQIYIYIIYTYIIYIYMPIYVCISIRVYILYITDACRSKFSPSQPLSGLQPHRPGFSGLPSWGFSGFKIKRPEDSKYITYRHIHIRFIK